MNKDINKQLQTVIGNLIGKNYFKLEFGCKFIFKLAKENLSTKDGLYTVTESRLPMIYVMSEEDGEHHDGFFTIDNFEDNPDEYEILGQEPTLNDVLLAIGMTRTVYFKTLGEYGRLAIDDEEDEKYDFNLQYIDLRKSLFNQSKETKLAIIKLLE